MRSSPGLLLTVNSEHVFGAGLVVEVIDALRDDDHRAALLPQPGFALRYGQMGGVGLPVQRRAPPVLVELPDPRWISREGLRRRQVLRRGNIRICSRVKSLLEVPLVAAHNNNPDHPVKTMPPPPLHPFIVSVSKENPKKGPK